MKKKPIYLTPEEYDHVLASLLFTYNTVQRQMPNTPVPMQQEEGNAAHNAMSLRNRLIDRYGEDWHK